MKREIIKGLLKSEVLDREVTVCGWVRSMRGNKVIKFIALNDGSCVSGVQIVADVAKFDEELLKRITTGACLKVVGKLVASQGGNQKCEIQASTIEVLGDCDPNEYPLQKKGHSMEFLREKAHLRPRTNLFGCILRIRHNMAIAIHQYFHEHGFYYFHSPLITINPRPMEEWQYSVKRLMDILLSLLALVLLSPVFLVTAIIVKCTSPGPIFYAQERIGYRGKPFKMHKFRSMYVDAEASGPALSSDDDPRITPFGRIMRKYRLDEIPQFYNVLKGTMSLVGPRPERQYFIDKIVERAPEYMLLHKVKPGITSWGQVKYGYAENVDEMVERLRYDLLYLENMSLATDIKILLYTVLIIFQGRGK